ncbi:MAG TPA: hypothetical protein VNO22_00670 [Planctomycetota bacterium]|nr:hypothetical protein [Planctomycetota bacterium]
MTLPGVLAVLLIALQADPPPDGRDFPPGWLPVQKLDDRTSWAEFRKIADRIHLYLPPDVPAVRGVFVCFVFHSADPRELARLWRFALVTVPWPFEYDLGHNDKRNGRHTLGHPVGSMDLLLRYLVHAARDTRHPELATAPLVGWLGQNGSHLGHDLYRRAPDRVIAWTDSFPNRLAQVPELTRNVPFAYAWEFTPAEEKTRREEGDARRAQVENRPTPPPDLSCRANTYGFPHGIYSKFNFFMGFLDRCIALRLPDELPPPGQPVRLRPVVRENGWAGDYNPVGSWNPIAPVREASGMIQPVWLPDEYAAWMWRSYHSARPDLRLTSPVVEYRSRGHGPDCGMGYGGQVPAGTPLRFAAEVKGTYTAVEFRDGHRLLGTAHGPPWQIEGIRLERGLHALFPVGVAPDGGRTAGRPGFLIVE